MAGDWFPLQFWRSRCPEIVRAASATGRSRHEVLGYVCDFWSWVSTESADGHVPGVRVCDLPEILGGDVTLWGALRAVGWVDEDAGGIVVPGWQAWLCESAKKRAKDAKRKRGARAEGDEKPVRKTSAKCPRNVRDASAKCPPTGQDRREEKKEEKTPLPPADAGDGVGGPDPEPTPAPETNPEPEPAPGVGPNPQAVAEHWNTHPGLVPCVASDPHRDRIVRSWATGNALWAAHWRAVIAFMGRTPLYCGGGQQQWRATVGWLLKNDNFTTVVERMLAEGSPPRALPGPVPPLKPVKETSAGAVARIIAQANTKTITPERPCTTPSTAPTGSPLGSATTVRRSA